MISKAFSDRVAKAGLFHRRVNRLVDYIVIKGMTLEIRDIPEGFLDARIRFDCGFLDARTLYRLAGDPENDLSDEYVDWALARGDQCYGFMDEDRLAAYGWYSTKPHAIMDNLVLHYDPDYVCMYKGYTHPDYRGQRLHGIGMAKAAEAFTQRGKKGLISYVESHDHPSLRSCERVGYRTFGTIWIVGRSGHYLSARTPRCRKFSFAVAAG